MIENLNLTHVSAVRNLSGLSTDVKPIKNIGTGSTFYEMNTGNTYVFSALNINPITNSGWWRIPIATGEGWETSTIAIDEIMESATRVFVTPAQRGMIGDIDALEESETRVFVTPAQREAIGAPVFISEIDVEADDEEDIEVPSDDAVYLLKVVQDTSTVLYVLADTSAEILLGTALTDVTIAHTDDNTWTVTNTDTTNAVTVTIKQFM